MATTAPDVDRTSTADRERGFTIRGGTSRTRRRDTGDARRRRDLERVPLVAMNVEDETISLAAPDSVERLPCDGGGDERCCQNPEHLEGGYERFSRKFLHGDLRLVLRRARLYQV